MQGVLVHVILISRIPKDVQTMNKKFYKMRRNRMISGVLVGLSDDAVWHGAVGQCLVRVVTHIVLL